MFKFLFVILVIMVLKVKVKKKLLKYYTEKLKFHKNFTKDSKGKLDVDQFFNRLSFVNKILFRWVMKKENISNFIPAPSSNAYPVVRYAKKTVKIVLYSGIALFAITFVINLIIVFSK